MQCWAVLQGSSWLELLPLHPNCLQQLSCFCCRASCTNCRSYNWESGTGETVCWGESKAVAWYNPWKISSWPSWFGNCCSTLFALWILDVVLQTEWKVITKWDFLFGVCLASCVCSLCVCVYTNKVLMFKGQGLMLKYIKWLIFIPDYWHSSLE